MTVTSVTSGRTSSGVVLSSGSTEYVFAGGVAVSTVVSNGGTDIVYSGGIVRDTIVSNGGTEYVSGGVASATIISSGGYQYVAGGSATNTVLAGGTEVVWSGDVTKTTISSGGYQDVAAGGVASETIVSNGGVLNVLFGGVASGAVVSSGGELVLNAGATQYATSVGGGGKLDLASAAYASGGSASIDASDVLTITEGGHTYTLQLAGGYAGETVSLASDGSGGTTVSIVCFAAGTAIRTVRDGAVVDVAVETLAVGDAVVTSSGCARQIRWIGHRRVIDCRRSTRRHEVMPICILAHAFGPDAPKRDLWVSPGHGICVDVVGEVLIPAHALVNNATIAQIDVDEVTYWHLELESHDILLAENLAVESYLDLGNRAFFVGNGAVTLFAAPDATPNSLDDLCRPFHHDDLLVEVVRVQMRERAKALGWTIDEAPSHDLHLLVDGARIDPEMQGRNARFAVPAGAGDVWLISGISRPADVSKNNDLRRLGACVVCFAIDDGRGAEQIILPIDPRLDEGFYFIEDPHWRWTNGRAKLPAELFAHSLKGCTLRVTLAGEPLPRWRAPESLAPWGLRSAV
ncbi:MAG TPA: Hint domain-containing protein [Methylocystis sp.]|nr:Hint domain-containing protein [Methylocystis sp.]